MLAAINPDACIGSRRTRRRVCSCARECATEYVSVIASVRAAVFGAVALNRCIVANCSLPALGLLDVRECASDSVTGRPSS
eukprot:8386835-Alexandrium_andersonii.AAC.1